MSLRLVKKISEKQIEWRNDPSTMQYVRQVGYITDEQQKNWMSTIFTNPMLDFFGIEICEKSKLKDFIKKPVIVGTCGLSYGHKDDKDTHRKAEWSLLIGPEYRGNGYATEALKLLLDYGFNNLGLERIWGEIFETNEASLKVAEKMGFKREGVLRSSYYKNGRRINSIMVGLLRDEWKR